MSETESLSSEDDASSIATDGSQSSMTGDSETEEEEVDPWIIDNQQNGLETQAKVSMLLTRHP